IADDYILVLRMSELMLRSAHVRFTPESRHLQCTSSCPLWAKADILLDHFSCLRDECGWNGYAERLSGLEIYHKLKSSGLLHRQVGGLRAFQDFGHVSGGSTEHILGVRPIGHQATIDGELPLSVHGRQLALCGELYNSLT